MRFIKAFWYSSPLSVFMPKPGPNQGRRDWNLFYLAISAALVNFVLVRTSILLQT
jgi:hypothetical protein